MSYDPVSEETGPNCLTGWVLFTWTMLKDWTLQCRTQMITTTTSCIVQMYSTDSCFVAHLNLSFSWSVLVVFVFSSNTVWHENKQKIELLHVGTYILLYLSVMNCPSKRQVISDHVRRVLLAWTFKKNWPVNICILYPICS